MADDERPAVGPPGALSRPRFEPEDRLTAQDLQTEQGWRRQRLRRHNRHLHGWGVVCGLWVAPAFDSARPWAVVICPGYAIAPYGDEILLACRRLVDLRDWLWSRPAAGAPVAYVAISYREAAGAPVSAPMMGCGCGDSGLRDSRLADCLRVDVLWERPSAAPRAPFDLCRDLPPCSPCPDTPYVVLAGVTIPGDEANAIRDGDIQNLAERVASMSVLVPTFVDCGKKHDDGTRTPGRDDLRSVGVGAHLI